MKVRFTMSYGILTALLLSGCSGWEVTMSSDAPYKSAHELQKIAGETASRVLPVETANTLPVPQRDDGNLVILILYYRESGRPNHRVVKLPDHAMQLDPVTGKVLRFWACRPEQVGIETPLRPVEGAGIRPGMDWEEFFHKRERFLAISPEVWEAYRSSAAKSSAAATVAREYWQLFLEITKAEVAPFYVAAAPDFFRWLRQIAVDK